VKKKTIRDPELFSAVFSCISPFALVGFVRYVRWIQTSSFTSTWEGIAAHFAGAVLTGLFVFSMMGVVLPAISLLRRRLAMKRAKAARVQKAQDETPPEEFFAAHRQTMKAINELILADAEQERPWEFSYSWNSPDRDLCGNAYQSWTVALTDEQKQLYEAFNCRFLDITLTPDTITYNIDGVRSFIYVIQYSRSFEHLQHLDGKWYFERTVR